MYTSKRSEERSLKWRVRSFMASRQGDLGDGFSFETLVLAISPGIFSECFKTCLLLTCRWEMMRIPVRGIKEKRGIIYGIRPISRDGCCNVATERKKSTFFLDCYTRAIWDIKFHYMNITRRNGLGQMHSFLYYVICVYVCHALLNKYIKLSITQICMMWKIYGFKCG